MADYDVVVIGGGPGGYAAALRASEEGASVALVEAEQPGGSCVHHACIPTNILMGAVDAFVEAREMDVLGVFSAGETFNFARAAARKDALVRQMASGIRTALRMGRVTVVEGRAAFTSPSALAVTLTKGGSDTLSAESYIIATGTRWEKPEIPGLPASRVLTADEVQALPSVPTSAVVIGDGPAQTAFGLEYATMLAAAGSEVALVTARANPLPGLDEQIVEMVRAALTDLGITIYTSTGITSGDSTTVSMRGEEATPAAAIVVAADVRRPFVESVNPGTAGIAFAGHLEVDAACRTRVPHIFAVGDVTGGAMLSSAATHMGETAAINATGGNARTRLGILPHVFHTIPEVGWVGITEREAREQGYQVTAGMADLSHNARAITLGARQGIVKVVAESELGAILGVHAIGPEAREIVAIAAALMQAEVTLAELAASVQWHPSVAEGLVQAARRALR